jgi:hypothetical protein
LHSNRIRTTQHFYVHFQSLHKPSLSNFFYFLFLRKHFKNIYPITTRDNSITTHVGYDNNIKTVSIVWCYTDIIMVLLHKQKMDKERVRLYLPKQRYASTLLHCALCFHFCRASWLENLPLQHSHISLSVSKGKGERFLARKQVDLGLYL